MKTMEALGNIRTAVIIDDSFDEVPKCNDLIQNVEGWKAFFTNVLEYESVEEVKEFYPGFDPDKEDELKDDDVFIEALWKQQDKIVGLVAMLFEDYKRKLESDRKHLKCVNKYLKDFKIEFTELGCDFKDKVKVDIDLIIIDLFMGDEQGDYSLKESLNGLKEILSKRLGNPPMIILMSRTEQLKLKASKFRDCAKIFASGFRYIKKKEIQSSNQFEFLLTTLARYRDDTLKLSKFVETWRVGVTKAIDRTISEIRQIDIEDITYIREFLLKEEETKTASYILDFFDRVLRYEVEDDDNTVLAAKELDTLSVGFPPVSIPRKKDVFRIFAKTLYQNPSRQSSDTSSVWPVAFGDIIGAKYGHKGLESFLFKDFEEGHEEHVFFVATPACDLLRKTGAKHVLLMDGILNKIELKSSCAPVSNSIFTPVISLKDQTQMSIIWNPSNLVTINCFNLKKELGYDGCGQKIGSLREVAALALQQKLLCKLGRVGELALPPLSYSQKVRLAVITEEEELKHLPMKKGKYIEARFVCVKDENKGRLIFAQDWYSEVLDAVKKIDHTKVFNKCSAKIKLLQEYIDIIVKRFFHAGLEVPYPLKKKCVEVKFVFPGKHTVIVCVVFNHNADVTLREATGIKAGLIIEVFDT